MNILFLAPAWKASLIKAFQETRTLKTLDINLIAADSDALSSALYFADRFHIVPPFDAPDFSEQFFNLCEKEKITAVIPLTNKAIAALDSMRADLNNKKIFPVLSPSETVNICLDKWKTCLFCQNNSIPTPDSVLYEKINLNIPIEFPLFLKKRKGEGSNDTCLIASREQLEALELKEEYIIQKYIAGPEYCIDILSDFNGEAISAVPRERITVRGGESLKGKTVDNAELERRGIEIAEKLKICGPANIQCLKDKQGNFMFTDINLRFGSGSVLTFAAGANFPEMLIKLLHGEKVENIIGKYEKNLFMLRYDEAIFTRGK